MSRNVIESCPHGYPVLADHQLPLNKEIQFEELIEAVIVHRSDQLAELILHGEWKSAVPIE